MGVTLKVVHIIPCIQGMVWPLCSGISRMSVRDRKFDWQAWGRSALSPYAAQSHYTFGALLPPPNRPSKMPAVITSFLAESPVVCGRRRVFDLASGDGPGAEERLLVQSAARVMKF